MLLFVMTFPTALCTSVRALTLLPTYTAATSGTVRFVAIIRSSKTPLEGAIHDHQTERPPGLSAWLGSFASFVAPKVYPGTAFVPVNGVRFAKSSFAGGMGRTVNIAFVLITVCKG